MPEWQIESKEYLTRLGLGVDDFEQQLRLPRIKEVQHILPLRDIVTVESLVPMPTDLLLYLIRKIRTVSGELPFPSATIRMTKIDPRILKIGQRFVYREIYQSLLEDVPDLFHRFLVSAGGLGDLGAYIVFGRDARNIYSLAFYIPPLIEVFGSSLIIMDGIHRNYIAKQSGATLNAILIENIEVPFPCSPRDWSEIQVISMKHKPKDIEKRFFELKKRLFRDLKYLGIDG